MKKFKYFLFSVLILGLGACGGGEKPADEIPPVDEQVVDVQVHGHSRANVVCFASVNDTRGIIQDESGHDEHNGRAHRQRNRRHLEEQVSQRGNHRDQQTNEHAKRRNCHGLHHRNIGNINARFTDVF